MSLDNVAPKITSRGATTTFLLHPDPENGLPFLRKKQKHEKNLFAFNEIVSYAVPRTSPASNRTDTDSPIPYPTPPKAHPDIASGYSLETSYLGLSDKILVVNGIEPSEPRMDIL